MEIGIVTHYDVHNHGAILQMYALNKVLNSLGHNSCALSFDKDLRYIDVELQSKYKLSVKSIPVYVKYFISKGLKKTLYNFRKHNLLDKFKRDNKLVEGQYGDSKDLIIVGSDEVFSTQVGLSDEFFNLNSPYKRVISYAASFGNTTIEDINKKREFQIFDGIKSFENISVRDFNSQYILKTRNIDSTIVCDPVILYGFDNELNKTKVKDLGEYILIYSYDNNMNGVETEKIKSYAAKMGLKTVSAGFYHKWCDINVNCNPIELLGYFKNANKVITDTFHGSVMSLITGKQFVAIIRGNSQKLGWLLKEYDLEGRICLDISDIEKIFNITIDYKKTNEIMSDKRTKSMKWLKETLL